MLRQQCSKKKSYWYNTFLIYYFYNDYPFYPLQPVFVRSLYSSFKAHLNLTSNLKTFNRQTPTDHNVSMCTCG